MSDTQDQTAAPELNPTLNGFRFYERRCIEDAGLVLARWPKPFRARRPHLFLQPQRDEVRRCSYKRNWIGVYK